MSALSTPKPSRPPPKNRGILNNQSSKLENHEDHGEQYDESTHHMTGLSTCTQTEEKWVEPMDVLLLAAENKKFLEENKSLNGKLQAVYGAYDQLHRKTYTEKRNVKLQAELSQEFNVDVIIHDAKQFKYYTGLTPDQFLGVYVFLVPNDQVIPIQFPTNRTEEVMTLTLKNHLFLTIMKLRYDFHYSDLAFRFRISKQTTSVIFTYWINYMFLRFGELSIWPHRNVIKENMPSKFKEEFPTTFGILDCTEIKINKPASLKAQSQTYSDYKSCNTMKGLVVCDPRGSVTFASMLFSGGISDKDIFVQSKFEDMLKDLLDEGYLLQGDGLMADKGFNIEEEVEKCGLQLNIPPFATIGKRMSKSDALLTKKIAKHRVHVERAIERIKRFKILSGKFKLS
ncbi:uncharacterized protein LOC133186406 isoform X2 [Saccostrea echinata]|uniref:uncharacterized protein LOC133186406 isoform X2 n=1 Tax=Saccostrea echinata TaxID=191078 RepID=UPI002A8047BD|nr:uncharacterized protein LOC133186406 isoform X2 [Saccostrea echinata]